VAGEHGGVRDVLGDHRLPEPLRRDEDDVVGLLHEVEGDSALDGLAVDALRPGPVEVGHRLEPAELATAEAPFETAAGAVLGLNPRDVLEDLVRAPAVLGGERHDVIEDVSGVAQTEGTKLLVQVTGHG
jgi:hypothetical protein